MNERPNQFPTKSAVRRAGSTIRAFQRGEVELPEMFEALTTLEEHRARHAVPLVKANNGLRKFCRSLELDGEVTQRLKKVPTIFGKLTREAGLDLSRMQDIGGCRVVLPDVTELRRLEARISQSWSHRVTRTSDYVTAPRSSGYRAVHIVVEWDGCLIEVQLRSQVMHAWAQLVERLSGMVGTNYKQDGSEAVQRYMALMSRLDAFHEGLGPPPTEEELDRLVNLGDEAMRALRAAGL